MANPEHLEILKQGPEAWNKWRRHDPLIHPNLSKADLTLADLSGADLSGATLILANLSGANLSGAIFDSTVFGDVDLSSVKGLESCEHSGPSYLDYHTFAKSGSLPLTFLRNCGLSDEFIDYLPSLFNQAIEYYSCFISYSTKDQEFADRLYSDLQNKGVRAAGSRRTIFKVGKRFTNRLTKLSVSTKGFCLFFLRRV